MVSSRQAIVCILLSFTIAVCAQAQGGIVKEQTASVTGKVTVKNKALAGIVVAPPTLMTAAVRNTPVTATPLMSKETIASATSLPATTLCIRSHLGSSKKRNQNGC